VTVIRLSGRSTDRTVGCGWIYLASDRDQLQEVEKAAMQAVECLASLMDYSPCSVLFRYKATFNSHYYDRSRIGAVGPMVDLEPYG
jgi:hypothetical protein